MTVELLPGGDAKRARHLGTAIIANDGTGSESRGNYSARFSKKGQPNSTWRTARVVGFERKRFLAWDLVLFCLMSARQSGGGSKRFKAKGIEEVRAEELPEVEHGR